MQRDIHAPKTHSVRCCPVAWRLRDLFQKRSHEQSLVRWTDADFKCPSVLPSPNTSGVQTVCEVLVVVLRRDQGLSCFKPDITPGHSLGVGARVNVTFSHIKIHNRLSQVLRHWLLSFICVWLRALVPVTSLGRRMSNPEHHV